MPKLLKPERPLVSTPYGPKPAGLTTHQFELAYGHLLAGIHKDLLAQLEANGCSGIKIHSAITMHSNPDAYGFVVRFYGWAQECPFELVGFIHKEPWWNDGWWVIGCKKVVE